jgi:glycine cleavage system H protein
MYPENFRYTKEHEWVRVDGDTGTVGITDHAQSELGDIVYVDLPKAGAHVEQGKSLGSVESVKAVSDIYSPVSGQVIEVSGAGGRAGEAEPGPPRGRLAHKDPA